MLQNRPSLGSCLTDSNNTVDPFSCEKEVAYCVEIFKQAPIIQCWRCFSSTGTFTQYTAVPHVFWAELGLTADSGAGYPGDGFVEVEEIITNGAKSLRIHQYDASGDYIGPLDLVPCEDGDEAQGAQPTDAKSQVFNHCLMKGGSEYPLYVDSNGNCFYLDFTAEGKFVEFDSQDPDCTVVDKSQLIENTPLLEQILECLELLKSAFKITPGEPLCTPDGEPLCCPDGTPLCCPGEALLKTKDCVFLRSIIVDGKCVDLWAEKECGEIVTYFVRDPDTGTETMANSIQGTPLAGLSGTSHPRGYARWNVCPTAEGGEEQIIDFAAVEAVIAADANALADGVAYDPANDDHVITSIKVQSFGCKTDPCKTGNLVELDTACVQQDGSGADPAEVVALHFGGMTGFEGSASDNEPVSEVPRAVFPAQTGGEICVEWIDTSKTVK